MKQKLRKWIFALGIIALVITFCGSQPVKAANTDRHLKAATRLKIRRQLREIHFTGTAVFYKSGHRAYHYSYGYSNYIKRQKNTLKTAYQWASLEKSLTAVLIMQQVEKGRLNLDDRLAKYFPKVQGAAQITLRQMLDMRSGLVMTAPQNFFALTDGQVVDYNAKNAKYKAKLNGQWYYQSVNYVLLAGILEKVTGEKYAQLANDNIFRPLKLHSIGFMPGLTTTSYYGGTVIWNTYAYPVKANPISYNRELGTGNLYSTPTELFKVQRAIMRGRIISKSALAQLRATAGGVYSGGAYNYGAYIYSRGCISGYESSMCIASNGKNGVVLMSNRYMAGATSARTKAVTQRIYRIVLAD